MSPYINIEKIAILQLLLFFTGPDFAHGRSEACEGRATNQKVPEEGQVFYIQSNSKWRYVVNGDGIADEYSYPKSKLVESGKYKYKWHDCHDGNIILELISNGPDYYYHVASGKNNYNAVKSLDACNDDRIEKYKRSNLKKGWIIWNEYKFYIPPTCQTFVTVGSHCNCGSTTNDWQFSIQKGISNSQKSSSTVSSTTRAEISTGIKIATKVSAGIEGIASAEASVETSLGAKFSTELGQSWLSESSSTWSRKTTKTITIQIPPNKCMGLYQKIAHYGPYEVGSSKTISRERRPKYFEC